jgi:hypothetical protein
MNAYATSADVFTRRLEEILADADGELRQAVAYVDRVILPEVRRESAGALRLLAVHLDRLADKIDPAGADPNRRDAGRTDSGGRDSGWANAGGSPVQ